MYHLCIATLLIKAFRGGGRDRQHIYYTADL